MKKIKLESEDEGVSRMKNIELDLIDLSDFQVPSTAIREIALLRELQHPQHSKPEGYSDAGVFVLGGRFPLTL